MHIIRLHILFILLLGINGRALAKDYPMINLTQKDGLPSNIVYDVYQDDEGFMWFATEKGVSRYNGLKFQNYTIEDGLPGNICFYFRKDRKGRLWVGNSTGKLVFYKDGVWHTEKNTPYLHLGFNGGVIADIVDEQDGSVTFTFQNKNFFASLQEDSLTIYDLAACSYLGQHNLSVNQNTFITTRFADDDHYKLVFARFDLLIDKQLKVIRRDAHPEVWFLLASQGKRYYTSDKHILDTDFRLTAKVPEGFLQKNFFINRIVEHGGQLYICTNRGLLTGTDTLMKDNNITTIQVDRNGYLWITTYDNGVYKLHPYFQRMDARISTYTGKVNFAHNAGRFLIFTTTNRNTYRMHHDRTQPLLDFHKRFGLLPFGNYMGHLVEGNDYYNFTMDKVILFRDIHSPEPKIYHRNLIRDQFNANAVYTTDSNIFFKGSDKVRYTRFQNFRTAGGVPNPLLYDILAFRGQYRKSATLLGGNVDPQNHLWFSRLDGLFKVIGDTAVFQPQASKKPLVNMIFLKNYLIGLTKENQLLLFRNYSNISCFVDSSIKNNCIWDKFIKVNDSTVLISTSDYYRILTLDPSAEKGYRIRVLENQFVPLQTDFVYACDSLVFFFKEQSVFSLPLHYMLQQDPRPAVYFTHIKTSSRDSISVLTPVSLNFAESRNVSIHYATNALFSPKISYEYAISNKENTTLLWQEAAAESINLTNIGYGTYFIRVRVKTYGGSYSDIKMLRLTIGKPYWLQWWFIGSFILFIGLIALVITLYIIKRKARQKEKEIRFLKSEFTALNALMNPHFVFNSLNSVQSLINKDDKQSASEYIRTISDLLRQNMYNISNELVSLDDEMVLVENYLKLEKLRFKEKLSYSIDIDPSVDMEMIMVPPLFIQPLVENAIKYGIWKADRVDGKVTVKVYPVDNGTAIDIMDNGQGLIENQNDEKHQSTAIKNIQKRLEQLSLIHNKSFAFSVSNIYDERGAITGACSHVQISD